MRMQRYTFFHKPPNVFKRKFQKSWTITTYTLYNIRPTKPSPFHHLSTFIHSKTTRKILTSTRPNLKAQVPTTQKTTINPRFTSPQTAITALLARKSNALTRSKHSFQMVIAALLHAKSIAFRGRKQHYKVTKTRKSLIDRQIQNTSKLAYLHTKNIPAGISQPANAVCKDNSERLLHKTDSPIMRRHPPL